MTGLPEVALEVVSVSKTFAGQKALRDVSFRLCSGKVTALLGMNGSGKSTLIKILAGLYDPDENDRTAIRIAGSAISLPLTPKASHENGMRFLHQDVGLVDALTVADNFAFVDRFRLRRGTPFINRSIHESRVRRVLDDFSIDVSPRALVRDLDPTNRTLVGLARTLQDSEGSDGDAARGHIVILDEPTATLPAEEVDRVLSTITLLKNAGASVVFVSHRIDEVIRIADEILILRDGRVVIDEPLGETSAKQLVEKVVGKELARSLAKPAPQTRGETMIDVSQLRGTRIRDVSFEVARGEILGIAGLVGCGRSELLRILGGSQAPTSGVMSIRGRSYRPIDPSAALQQGVTSVPQDRRSDGIVSTMSVAENLTLGRLDRFTRGGFLMPKAESRHADTMIADFGIKTLDRHKLIGLLSGGNQQKAVVARASSLGASVLLLDEPTQGVDALAKRDIADIIRAKAADGMSVVLGSTDIEDFVGVCDRVLVLDRGQLVGELHGTEITEANLARLTSRGVDTDEGDTDVH